MPKQQKKTKSMPLGLGIYAAVSNITEESLLKNDLQPVENLRNGLIFDIHRYVLYKARIHKPIDVDVWTGWIRTVANVGELVSSNSISKCVRKLHDSRNLLRHRRKDAEKLALDEEVFVFDDTLCEDDMDDDSQDSVEDDTNKYSSAEALVTMKEGKGNSFSQTPPRRANPPRTKKKNRLIFNDDEETDLAGMRSPRKHAKISASPMKGTLSTPDKKAAQATGVRLRNLLKLPKAHKWVCYEWFYSNLDIPLFNSENDFCICLKESFPQLKTYKIRRAEWNIIRRLMGKPRRCSPAFFMEEREALNKKRERIRLLQQRKITELKTLKDLPDEIPMPLVIGTKVTARLRKPQDGLFTGSIDALDTVNNTYRVTFERSGLGTHSIPDYEVLSNEPQDTMPLSAFQQKHRPRQNIFTPPRFVPGLQSPQLANDPLLGGSPLRGQVLSMEGGTYGGFPIKFLVLVTRLSKILTIKKDWIKKLKNMNTEAEKKKSFEEPIDMEFQKKYASIVLELETLNKDLNEYLLGVQQFCQEIAPDHGIQALEQPNELKKKCERDSEETVARNNAAQGKRCVKTEKSLKLVAKLTSLLYQIKNFAENDLNSFEFKSLQESLSEIKATLEPENISVFQNNVEIHVNHIQSGLSQMGNLSAFAETTPFSL